MNGYENFSTWETILWIEAEESSYKSAMIIANWFEGKVEPTKQHLKDWFEEWVCAMDEEINREEINWTEVAENFIEQRD